MPVSSSTVRSKVSASTGGAPLLKLRSGSAATIQAMAAGKHRERQDDPGQALPAGRPAADVARCVSLISRLHHVEHAHPAELGELGLVRVEHVHGPARARRS